MARKKQAEPNDEDIDEEIYSPEDSLKGARNLFIFIGAAVLIGIIAFALMKSGRPAADVTKYSYNQFPVEKRDGTWYTYAQLGSNLYEVSMRYGPRELESVRVEGDIGSFRDRWGFYHITIDPTEESFGNITMAHAEVSLKLVPHFRKGLGAACTVMTDDCYSMNASHVTCDNSSLPVIFLNQAPGPLVRIEGNCATIQGEGEDIIKAADRFMYNMYGIMR
jgi:hypothetical protein